MNTANLESIYQLSPMQQGMLFHSLLHPHSGTYCQQLWLTLEGDMDVNAFQRAWDQVVARHPAMRTAFFWEGLEKPHQAVCRTVQLPWDLQDWRQLPPQAQSERFQAWLVADRERSFILSQAPLQRFAVFRLGETRRQFLWTVHHMLLDGWSWPLVLREVFSHYVANRRGEKPAPAPARPYRDYILWLQQQNRATAEAFWKSALAGFTAPTPLVVDRPGTPSEEEKPEYGRQTIGLAAEVTASLRALCARHKLTLSTIVQAAWGLLLSRYCGEPDVVFGTVVAGRPPVIQGVDGIVGLFINTIPTRVRYRADEPVLAILERVQNEQLASRDFDYASLVDVQACSEVPRGKPLFESLVVFENFPRDTRQFSSPVDDLELVEIGGFDQTNYPLSLLAVPGQQLSLTLIYDCARFDLDAMERMLGHLANLLAGIAADAARPARNLGLLTSDEQAQFAAWNSTTKQYPDLCVHEVIEEYAVDHPGDLAVTFGQSSVTYGELNRRADQLADHLVSLGVGPEVLVGVCMERSLELVVSLLAVLKAGGAYLPIDPDYPAERLRFVMEDAAPPVVLTQQGLLARLPETRAAVIAVDVFSPPRSECPRPQRHKARPGNLAYVIYTSGSTGKPKGVMNVHRGLANRLFWMQEQFRLTRDDCVLQKTPYSFDVSVWEFFWPLMTGARMVVAQPEGHRDPEYLADLIARERVTTVHFVPSMLQAFLQQEPRDRCVSLRQVICSGEALPYALQERFFAALDADLYNLYGPTEASIDVTCWRCQKESALHTVPIGRPISNIQIYVLDADLNQAPIGVPGELHIGGVGLARGYWRRADLTGQKFIPNPFRPEAGALLYKTGDLARYLPQGAIEYLGRLDFQVKIRGFRIELGEIENALLQHAAVRDCVVTAADDGQGEKHLVAYVVLAEQQPEPAAGLREFLKKQLPEYMVPSTFVTLPALPLSSNGKVDRKALPAANDIRRQPGASYEPPRTQIEEVLASIWQQTLRVPRIGIHDNFFESGGHSLLATQAISRVRDALQVDLPLRALFDAPTIASLARKIEEARGVTVWDKKIIHEHDREGTLPLSFAQQRLWFLEQLQPGTASYNIPLVLRLTGELNLDALTQAVTEMWRRHEALRTVFAVPHGQPVQVVLPASAIQVPLEDLSALPSEAAKAEGYRGATEEGQRPFDLSNGPLARLRLIRLAPDQHLFLVTMHHIISDGWSLSVFLREFSAFYAAYAEGRESPLPELDVQYADFAAWQRDWLRGDVLARQLSYWRRKLAAPVPAVELPADYVRPAVQTTRGAEESCLLSAQLANSLRALSQKESVTLFMTLLAGFQTLIARCTGLCDVSIGTPIAGRTSMQVEPLIGFFANTLVLRTDLSGDPTVRDLLRRVRETALQAYEHQDAPFEKLVEELRPERDLSRTPLFQVMFVLQDLPAQLQAAGLGIEPLGSPSRISKFDLTLYVVADPAGIRCMAEYNTDLFKAETIRRLFSAYECLLNGMVANPRQRLSQLPLLTEAERRTVLTEWNDTARAYPSCCLHQLVEQQARLTPERVAVACAGNSLTYAELNARANQLAHCLRSLGVGPGRLVGIALDRGTEMVAALLGVLKAGAAYVPLDPEYPPERVQFMLEDSGAAVLITEKALLQYLPEHPQVLCLDRDWERIAAYSRTDPDNAATPASLAYVIYTSGSTGKPKGVQIPHQALVNFLSSMRSEPGFSESDVLLAVTTLSFDIAGLELYLPLVAGGRVEIASRQATLDGRQLMELLQSSGATVMQATPASWRMLVESGWKGNTGLKMLCGGEALSRELADALLQRGGELWNLYGPTETTIWSTAHKVESDGAILVGQPIANTQVYILDEQGNPAPVGVPGELHIGGAGLALGYWRRPDLTAEKFVTNPFRPGERMYKTGDLARRRSDGFIECLGRRDHQVKVRGHRIELGEIESVLAEHQGVRQCVVIAREDRPGDQRLVAYVVADTSQPPSASELRMQAQRRLPPYMVPASFVFLSQLPLTPNGKVDRRSLPQPEATRPDGQAGYTAPQNEIERAIAAIWQKALRVEKAGRDDNFFDLGGHSLLLVEVHNALLASFPGDLALIELFRFPTIKSLAERLVGEADTGLSSRRAEDRATMRYAALERNRQARKNGRLQPELR